MDATTQHLIEAIDVYETGLNDEYAEDVELAPRDREGLIALRNSAKELIDTIDLLVQQKG
jgi:hypothetical protein